MIQLLYWSIPCHLKEIYLKFLPRQKFSPREDNVSLPALLQRSKYWWGGFSPLHASDKLLPRESLRRKKGHPRSFGEKDQKENNNSHIILINSKNGHFGTKNTPQLCTKTWTKKQQQKLAGKWQENVLFMYLSAGTGGKMPQNLLNSTKISQIFL